MPAFQSLLLCDWMFFKKQPVTNFHEFGTNIAISGTDSCFFNQGTLITMKKSLLVYEPCSSNLPYVAFILTLKHVRCTHARSPEEAHNWLEAARHKVVSFDLVLVTSLCHQTVEDEFFSETAALNLPLVMVQHDADGEQPTVVPQQILCPADDLLDYLRRRLELEDD